MPSYTIDEFKDGECTKLGIDCFESKDRISALVSYELKNGIQLGRTIAKDPNVTLAIRLTASGIEKRFYYKLLQDE